MLSSDALRQFRDFYRTRRGWLKPQKPVANMAKQLPKLDLGINN